MSGFWLGLADIEFLFWNKQRPLVSTILDKSLAIQETSLSANLLDPLEGVLT